ncbi:hypothetical protein PX52LOC_04238 [Limnoglobus roseus]|uniref:Uncharacterized protein n=1 Tax=Limnoglobus roseus TaxID=2598579 RepID=A0A5C1AFB5_9BACT|nr:hypothetical protein PX52LOC_04238 [Limnoglobus roseus]
MPGNDAQWAVTFSGCVALNVSGFSVGDTVSFAIARGVPATIHALNKAYLGESFDNVPAVGNRESRIPPGLPSRLLREASRVEGEGLLGQGLCVRQLPLGDCLLVVGDEFGCG